MTCEGMGTTIGVDDGSILANDAPIIIPEYECAALLDTQVQNDMEVAHLSPHPGIPGLEPLLEHVSPVNHPTQLVIEQLPMRMRQHRHKGRIPFRLGCPLIVPLLNWTGP